MPLARAASTTQRSTFQFQDTVAPPRELKIMGDQDRRQVTPFAKIGEQIENHLPGPLVQIAGRLVGQEQGRTACEGARDGNALLLPSGKFPGPMVRAITQSQPPRDSLRRSAHALAPFTPRMRSGILMFSLAENSGKR